MRSILLMSVAYVMASMLNPTIANAAPVCADRESLVSRLESKYSESAIAIGISNGGSLLEVFVSSSGTWTLLVTKTNGESCAILAGDSWEGLHKLDRQIAAQADPT